MFFYVYRFKKFKLFFVGKICGEKGGFQILVVMFLYLDLLIRGLLDRKIEWVIFNMVIRYLNGLKYFFFF